MGKRGRKDKRTRSKAVPQLLAAPRLTIGERGWMALGASSLLLLVLACRGAIFGAPVADDYVFLYWLRFHHPFDLFDSMGGPLYWRPLTRQVYYAAVQPFLFSAPWVVALLHVALFLAIYFVIYRVARRILPPPLAAAAAAFPLFAEPARLLLVWPTQIQYLLPMLTAALAIHEAIAGRILTASLAGLATLLCHEWGILVVAALPVVAWFRARRLGEVLRWGAAGIAVLALWGVGHEVARTHGAAFIGELPGGESGKGLSPAAYLETLRRAVISELNLEDVYGWVGTVLGLAYGLITAVAVYLASRKAAARRLAQIGLPLLGGALWWLVGVAPLALIVVGWNNWRTTLPGLWLGVSWIGFLGVVQPWLAAAFVLVRVISLLACPIAAPDVTLHPPRTTSTISYQLVVRQQRTVESARRRVTQRYPRLERGAEIGYWGRLPMTEIAFYDQMAPRVWYDDSTLTWRWLWKRGASDANLAAAIGFNADTRDPAVIIEPAALGFVHRSLLAYHEKRLVAADSLANQAVRSQSPVLRDLSLWANRVKAKSAYFQGDYARAESLNRIGLALYGESADYYGLTAVLAYRAGDRARAMDNARRGLELDPKNPFALGVARALSIPPAAAGH